MVKNVMDFIMWVVVFLLLVFAAADPIGGWWLWLAMAAIIFVSFRFDKSRQAKE